MSMLLTIDIGNTSISWGLLQGRRIMGRYALPVHSSRPLLKSECERMLRQIKRKHSPIKQVLICSVVPQVTKNVQSIVRRQLGVAAFLVGRDVHVPIINRYEHPDQVGQDRLVCAYAAKQLYGTPAVIIDFGTATTFDVVSRKGEYLGGLIVPGVKLSTDSLFQKAALLPQLQNIKPPRKLVGRNTKESILSGLFYGYGAMCSGLIQLISQKYPGNIKVIVTGGYTSMMKKYIASQITKIDRDLAFKGMSFLKSFTQ